MGFPPRSGKARQEWMGRLAKEPRTVVAFESPHRIGQTLHELTINLGIRQIQIHREITKINEEMVISPTMAGVPEVKQLGEFVLVICPSNSPVATPGESEAHLVSATDLVGCMTTMCKMDVCDAILLAAKAFGLEPVVLKKAWKKHRILANRQAEQLP
jgi:16S rRNA C1402 (ribose-2'-O) methylase RsmI